MRSTKWADGYGFAVELFDNGPEECPDGVTRRYITVGITGDEYREGSDYIEVRFEPSELADFAGVLTDAAWKAER